MAPVQLPPGTGRGWHRAYLTHFGGCERQGIAQPVMEKLDMADPARAGSEFHVFVVVLI